MLYVATPVCVTGDEVRRIRAQGRLSASYTGPMTIPRKAAAVLALGTLTALAPLGAAPADANHENYKGVAVLCYVKTGDYIRCFHAGPMSGLQFTGN